MFTLKVFTPPLEGARIAIYFIINPPRVLSRVTVFLGEVSYGVYLWTLLFQELFGVVGILYGILTAIVTEFPLRRREIVSRLSL